jgi:hypothetical protein
MDGFYCQKTPLHQCNALGLKEQIGASVEDLPVAIVLLSARHHVGAFRATQGENRKDDDGKLEMMRR